MTTLGNVTRLDIAEHASIDTAVATDIETFGKIEVPLLKGPATTIGLSQ